MADIGENATLVVDSGLGSWGSAGDELAAESGGAGFGWIGKCWIGFGWKIYAQGTKNSETFFPFVYKNPDSEKASKEQAIALIKKMNLKDKDGVSDARPYACFGIHLYKAHVLSKDVSTWMDDRWWIYPLWTVNWKTIVQPALDKIKLKVGNQEVWGLIRFKEDPSGKTHKGVDRDGNPAEVRDLVFYLGEIYTSEEDAKSHVKKKDETGKAEPTFPKGYTAEGWHVQAQEIKEAYDQTRANTDTGEFSPDDVIANLATIYDLRESWIKEAIK